MKKLIKILILMFFVFFAIFYFSNKNNPLNNKDSFNILILGLDPRNDILEKTETTDTIIFSSINFKKNIINLISLPRDLWFYQEKSKINQIYPNNIDDFETIQTKFDQLIGQNIDKTVIFTTQNLIDLVNLLDGVNLYLDQGFKDEKYPNPEYVKNPIPSIPIYKTIEFKSGLIHLDQSNVTEFVRSRHSSESSATGGTDLGRIKRQQVLIEAIFKKMFNYRYLTKLNYFYRHNLKTNLSYNDIVNLSLKLKKDILNLSLQKIELPIGETAKEGVIYYPNRLTEKQWAFIPSDPDYKSFKEFIDNSIK
jgi:LCP family protein required for cell wall assembly